MNEKMGKGYFVEGLPISNKFKVTSVIIGFVLMALNHNMHVFSSVLDYPNREYISLIILAYIVIISIGSSLAEGIIIGLALFTVMSAWYDFSVLDITDLRMSVFIGGVIVLAIATVFGKIGLFSIFKGQLGLGAGK